jgi:AcrR family transcriptional regulator
MSNPFTSRPEAARRGYHHGNLRESLIDAARFLIAERGPQGFTLIEAARLVDVSPAAPYRHFKDREALVEAVAERGFGVFAERLREAHRTAAASATGASTAMQPLQAMGAAYLAFSREEPGFYGAMFLAARSGEATGGQAFALLTEAVQRALSGDGPPPANAQAAAMQIWALAHGVAILATTGRWPGTPGTPSPDSVLASGADALVAAARNSRKDS